MGINLEFDYIWIPSSINGQTSSPYEGMRTTIRWQKRINEFLECARDIQWEKFTFDPKSLQGNAICRFSTNDTVPIEWLEDGELIEILSGHRVLAIGRIIN